MTPRDWFTLVLRYFGITEALAGLNDAIGVFAVHAQWQSLLHSQPTNYVAYGIVHVLLAVWLLFMAPQIARFFYPGATNKPSELQQSQANPNEKP
ncbi:MAG: hypothetical protein QOD99_2504 [Chthoniobacter sp.]|jgi:membrane protein YdbS with pleckstrin-like domain|nr:hypothetical protein [Chthoniobacter sp.]